MSDQGTSGDASLSFQDLLSNALAAVIVLTIIAMAISGTGREFFRPPEDDVQPGAHLPQLRAWIPPDPAEEREIRHVWVQVTVDSTEMVGRLSYDSINSEERRADYYVGGHNDTEHTMLIPLERGARWRVGIAPRTGVERLRVSVVAEEILLIDAAVVGRGALCSSPVTFLAVCADDEGSVSAQAISRCGETPVCGGG